MWALRRLKKLGLDSFTLTDYYMKEVRVHLEFAVPVWHSGLSLKLARDIERVQRIAINIILGDHSLPYVQSCTKLGLQPLYIRRNQLCENFAVKTASKSRHKDLFEIRKGVNHTHDTRNSQNKFSEHMCRTKRFYDSSLPYLTRILNNV